MAANTSMLHVRVDDDTKAQATEALAALGLSVSDAVRLFLRRVVVDQAFPLELKVPNAKTRAAMAAAWDALGQVPCVLEQKLPLPPVLQLPPLRVLLSPLQL